MARAGIGLGAKELAQLAGVSYPTVNRFEKGESVAQASVDALEGALADKGARFSARAGRITVSTPA